MQLSDRIAVIYRGKILAIVDAKTATKAQLGLLMAGITPTPEETPVPPTSMDQIPAA
jgi:ABC-type sugar transport system ATPase subunit